MMRAKHKRVDMQAVAELRKFGLGPTEIGKILGHNGSSIFSAIKRLDAAEKPAQPEPPTLKELDPHAERVRVLLVEGWGQHEIAELTGLTPMQVHAAIMRLKLHFKRASAAPKPAPQPQPHVCKLCGQALPPKDRK